MEPSSVPSLCNTLARSKLLPPDEVRSLFKAWQVEGKDAAEDVGQFVKWLVARQAVTEFQVGLVLKGNADRLFIRDYKLIDRIGKGRMAGVYKARHRLGQVVAVKILPPSKVKDVQSFGRFQREARMAVKFKHPNVVRTFQAGEDDGLHFIVMEYLDGETLEDVLARRGKLPPAEAVRLIHQALLGLQHMHEKDMVHRDLKPANLMLVPGHVAGRPDHTLNATVKVLDVGLGRALFDEGDPDSPTEHIDLTAAGAILGSPDYMAPEQARDAHRADVRSDIYALGCVLYHAVAGQVPFPDGNLVRKMVKHATEPPKPLRSINPEAPEGLQKILDGMMAKDPAQRFPTPERAAQALQVFLVAGSARARTPESDPTMKSYLEWLKAQQPEEDEPPPVATPAARPAPQPGAKSVTKQASPVSVDVELVPVPKMPPAKAPKTPATSWRLSNRDLILMGVSAGAVVLAVAVGLFVSRAFQPTSPVTPPDTPSTHP